jgi:neurotransmitter:Na+ symporter, NSS family
MNIPEPHTGTWSSTGAFVWVAVGSCVGMGTLLRFPALVQGFGAAPFLLAYGLCLLLMAWPLLVAEWGLGRWMRGDLVNGFAATARMAGLTRAWWLLGAMMVLTAGVVLSYYSVIAGWGLAYWVRAAAGLLNATSNVDLAREYQQLVHEPERGLAWHTLFMVGTCIVVAHGFRSGLERLALRLLPATLAVSAVLLLTLLLGRGPSVAWSDLLAPKVAYWDVDLWLAAVREAFITVSLGIGVMMTLGSYLPRDTRLMPVALGVIGLYLVFALVAALNLFLLGESAAVSGLELVFIGLPMAMPDGVAGVAVGLVMYGLLVVMSLTSAVVLLEVVTRYMMERKRLTRIGAATSAATVIWILGVGSLMSFAGISALDDGQLTVFDAASWVTGQLAAPLAALAVCVFAGRLLPPDLSRSVFGGVRGYAVWSFLLRYPARIGAVVIVLEALGVFRALRALWL